MIASKSPISVLHYDVNAAGLRGAIHPSNASSAPAKRLTRLEQLRLEQEQRVKALNGAAPAAEAKPASGQ
jgi:hypothetical protein